MTDDAEDPLDRLAGEPLLGPRQADLVDALTCRLHHGPPLSLHDAQAVGWLAAVVGLAYDDVLAAGRQRRTTVVSGEEPGETVDPQS